MTVSLALLPFATNLGAILAVIDAVLRIRKHGNGSAFAIIELPLALLLFVSAFTPVQHFVSTTIPSGYLVIPLEIILIVLLVLRSSRKGGLIWLTVVAVIVNGVTAFLAVTKMH